MDVAGATQSPSELRVVSFCHVVDQSDGELEASLQPSKESEEPGDICRAIFIHSVQSNQGIEEQESWLKTFEGILELATIFVEVEPEARSIDDVEVQLGDVEASVTTDGFDSLFDDGESIFGEVDDHPPTLMDLESAEAASSGSYGYGEVETEPCLAALGRSTNDADGLLAPKIVDEPFIVRGSILHRSDVNHLELRVV